MYSSIGNPLFFISSRVHFTMHSSSACGFLRTDSSHLLSPIHSSVCVNISIDSREHTKWVPSENRSTQGKGADVRRGGSGFLCIIFRHAAPACINAPCCRTCAGVSGWKRRPTNLSRLGSVSCVCINIFLSLHLLHNLLPMFSNSKRFLPIFPTACACVALPLPLPFQLDRSAATRAEVCTVCGSSVCHPGCVWRMGVHACHRTGSTTRLPVRL